MPRPKQPTPQDQKAQETEKKLEAAIGNTNEEQVNKRNAIADGADEFRQSELQQFDGKGVVPPDPEEVRAEAEARAAEDERARLEAEAQEAEARALQEGDAGRTFTLKVNGRDVQMTEAELLARAGKVASADEYLQMAQEAVKRTQALAPSQDVSVTDGEAVSEEVLTSALQGDREAIRKVAQRLNGLSRRDVQQVVDDRSTFHDAVNWFRGEYQDVVKDPFLYRLVVEEDKKIAQTDPDLPYRDRLKKAGDTIRTWKRGFAPAPDTNPKLVRKASAPSVPAAGSRQSAPKDEEADEPVESVIDAMAKSRGQENAIRTPQGMFGVKSS